LYKSGGGALNGQGLAETKEVDEQEKTVAMFVQDIVSFDFGFSPKQIIACNYRNVFLLRRKSYDV